MSLTLTPYEPDKHDHKGRFSLRAAGNLSALALVYAGLVSLTGCATSSELESLRAEVAKANATAARAEAEASRTQRELSELKAAATPPGNFYKPGTPPIAPLTRPSGYKWGKLRQYLGASD